MLFLEPYDYQNAMEDKKNIDHKTGFAPAYVYDEQYYQDLVDRQDAAAGALAVLVIANATFLEYPAAALIVFLTSGSSPRNSSSWSYLSFCAVSNRQPAKPS